MTSSLASIQPTQQFSTYQNPTYGVTIQYPSDWTKNETKLENRFVKFDSQATNLKGFTVAEVRLGTYYSPSGSLTDVLNNSINGYRNNTNWIGFHLVDSNTSSSLAGRPAYKFVATFNYIEPSIPQKYIGTGTIVGSKVYYIQAIIDADQYSNYFPTIQKMIDSFEIQPTQYATSNMTNATAAGGGNMTSAANMTSSSNPLASVPIIGNLFGGNMTSSSSAPTTSNMTNETAPTATPSVANMTSIQSNQSTINQANNYQFVRKWGSKGTGDGQFNFLNGLTIDSSGNVYVGDSDNNRIQVFAAMR